MGKFYCSDMLLLFYLKQPFYRIQIFVLLSCYSIQLSFLKRLLPIIKTLGATGLLIEYEDMFPYTGSIQALAAKNAYEENELKVGGFNMDAL